MIQKCDAKRPCTTCALANSISECVYDDEKRSHPAGIYLKRRTDGHLSGQHLGGADPVEIPTVISTHSPAESNPIPSTSNATRVVTYEPSSPQAFRADQVPHGHSSGVVLARRNSFERQIPLDSNPSISIFSSFLPSTIPPELRIPLSFLGGERLQVQTFEIDAIDLDMRWCVLE
jgi:hypothetical protein